MDDRDGTITTPTPSPDTEDTGGQGNVTVTNNDVSTDELDEFRRWKANRDSTAQTPWPVPNVNDVEVENEPEPGPEEAAGDSGPSMEERIAQLEHTVSRIPTNVLLSRSPVTNPVDDPDDPPMNDDPDFPNDVNRRTRGDWGGHPWSVLVKDRESDPVA